MTRYLLTLLLIIIAGGSVYSQTTAFTYQGSLKDGASAANGNYDFEFALFDAVTAGNQIGSTLPRNTVAVANGIFSVSLDFGSQFPGANRFLEIHVRPTGQPGITVLAPRQPVNSAPYSVKSLNTDNAGTAANASQLGGVAANQYVVTTDPRMTDARPPIAGNGNYIQNQSAAPQSSSNFSISGSGTAGGGLSGNIVNATTQFNLGGSRILGNAGSGNVFAGVGAGAANTTGSSNALFGSGAGTSNTTGSSNSFIGNGAGNTNTTGGSNTIIGANADVTASNLTNATAIGANAVVGQSNSLILGSVSGVNGATSDTRVGIGTSTPLKELHVRGAGDQEIMIESSDVNGRRWTLQSSAGTSNGNFQIVDRTANLSRLTILDDGSVGIGTTSPDANLEVNGVIKLALAGGGSNPTSVCWNSLSTLSLCGSSRRFKTDIDDYAGGLDLLRKMRPVSFTWKDGGRRDVGFIAEEMNEIEPLLTFRNPRDEITGVNYGQISTVLVNSIKEQQAQIEAQHNQIELQQKEIERLKSHAAEMDALKKLVCLTNKKAEICKE